MSCARPARAASSPRRSCARQVSAAWCTWTAEPTPGPSRACPSSAAVRRAPENRNFRGQQPVASEDSLLPLVLSLVNVGADEERYLRSVLALLKDYLEPSWCIAARLGDLPDAVLVDMDSKEGRQVWENVDFGGTPRIALSRDHVLAAEWTLLKPIRPGGPLSLTEVLTAVAGKLQLSPPTPSAPTSKWRPFADLVRKACHKSYPADVMLATGSALVVDPPGQVFYSSRTTDELAALLRNRRRIDGRVVAVPDVRKFAARLARWRIMPRPLEELLWLTGLVTGAGQSLGAWDPREIGRAPV